MKLPQLSLRELFLLVALAAMGCGWGTFVFNTAGRLDELRNAKAEASQSEANRQMEVEQLTEQNFALGRALSACTGRGFTIRQDPSNSHNWIVEIDPIERESADSP